MLRSKWVMLCPMARTGSSHTSELLNYHKNLRSHHGLFNEGPFGRWPADEFLAEERKEYYSSILDEKYNRIGGQEHSSEFLDEYIFTENPKYNPVGWECIGFKIQFVHFVHMPDLRDYLIRNKDIKILVNTRRHLLEHSCAELWCQNGNSRAARANEAYAFGRTEPISVDPANVLSTFKNLCRYRKYAIELFGNGSRDFFEWSYEDMFRKDGSLDDGNHLKLFDFLEMKPSVPFQSTFSQTPRPVATEYFKNYDALERFAQTAHKGVFKKYFDPDYDAWKDHSWPVLPDYDLEHVMIEKDNSSFRV